MPEEKRVLAPDEREEVIRQKAHTARCHLVELAEFLAVQANAQIRSALGGNPGLSIALVGAASAALSGAEIAARMSACKQCGVQYGLCACTEIRGAITQ